MSEQSPDPPGDLPHTARALLAERDALWEAIQAGEHPELAPLDELEEARMFAALQPALPGKRTTRWPGLTWAAAGLAAAALAAVLLWPRAESLPAYTLTVSGGDQVVRSPGTSDRYSPGSRLELVLQPAEPVEREVEVRIEAHDSAGHVVPLAWPVQRGRAGALRVVTVLGNELTPGVWELHITLGSGAHVLRHTLHVEGP